MIGSAVRTTYTTHIGSFKLKIPAIFEALSPPGSLLKLIENPRVLSLHQKRGLSFSWSRLFLSSRRALAAAVRVWVDAVLTFYCGFCFLFFSFFYYWSVLIIAVSFYDKHKRKCYLNCDNSTVFINLRLQEARAHPCRLKKKDTRTKFAVFIDGNLASRYLQ